jgi:hypothetical protein
VASLSSEMCADGTRPRHDPPYPATASLGGHHSSLGLSPGIGLRPRPGLVRARRAGLRTAGLNPDARPDRHRPPVGTQAPSPAPVLNRGTPRPWRLPSPAPLGRPLTLGRRHHRLKGFRRWAPARPVSGPDRQPATGLPGNYPDRTCTGRRRRASHQVMTWTITS